MTQQQEPYTAAQFKQAIRALYFERNEAVRKKANEWLQQFQKSHEAWEISIDSLQKADASAEEAVFCAQTLHRKAQRRHEIVEGGFNPLISALLQLIRKYAASNTHSVVLTKLCLALAAFVIIPGTDAHTPVNMFNSTLSFFDGVSDPDADSHALLEFLSVLPEECEDEHLSLSKTKRTESSGAIRSCGGQVLQVLITMDRLGREQRLKRSEHLRFQVFKCLRVWVEFDGISPALVVSSGLMDQLFHSLASGSSLSIASEAISATCAKCSTLGIEQIQLSEIIFARLLDLFQLYHAKHNGNPSSPSSSSSSSLADDSDWEVALVKVTVSAAEAFIKMILQPPTDRLSTYRNKLVEALVEYTGSRIVPVSSAVLDYWAELLEVIKRECPPLLAHFDILFVKVSIVASSQAQFPMDYEEMDEELKDQFSVYRNDIRELLRAIVIGRTPTSTLDFLAQIAKSYGEEFEANGQAGKDGIKWRRLEMLLHALSTVTKSVPVDESTFMPNIISSLPRLQPKHPGLFCTAALLIGQSSRWISRHPSLLDPSIRFLEQTFNMPEEDSLFPMRSKQDHTGAVAFLQLCSLCAPVLAQGMQWNYLTDLLSSINTKNVRTKSKVLILEGICKVFSFLPPQTCQAATQQLAGAFFSDLDKAAIGANGDKDRVVALSKLLVILRAIKPEFASAHSTGSSTHQPLSLVMQKFWGLFSQHYVFWKTNPEVLSMASKALAEGLANPAASGIETIIAALEWMIRTYEGGALDANLLQITSSCLPLYEKNNHLSTCLSHAHQRLTDATAQTLSTAPGKFDQLPDVTKHFFDFSSACLDSRIQVVTPESLGKTVELALRGLEVQHKEAGTSLLRFLQSLCSLQEEYKKRSMDTPDPSTNMKAQRALELLHHVFVGREMGVRLVKGLVAAASLMPAFMIEEVSETLRQICLQLGVSQFSAWLKVVVLSDPAFPRPNLTQQVKEKFCIDLLTPACYTSKHKFKRALKMFCGGKRKGGEGMPASASSLSHGRLERSRSLVNIAGVESPSRPVRPRSGSSDYVRSH